jgi:hypothetical protein
MPLTEPFNVLSATAVLVLNESDMVEVDELPWFAAALPIAFAMASPEPLPPTVLSAIAESDIPNPRQIAVISSVLRMIPLQIFLLAPDVLPRPRIARQVPSVLFALTGANECHFNGLSLACRNFTSMRKKISPDFFHLL